jgi:hypothetical protein
MSAPLGYQTLYELDINPEGTASFVRLADGLVTASPSNNESIDQKSYLDDEGGQSSEVTGFQYIIAFSGDRIPGDAAQDWIFERLFSLGELRHTDLRITGADGSIITGDVTIANITPPGGDANATQACGFEMHFNGKPTITPPVAATALGGTYAAGSVTGTTKCTATPGASSALYYRLTAAQLSRNGRQYVDIGPLTAYTSGADIVATAGQYLNVFELDAFRHLVKFDSHLVAAGEVNPGT